MVDRPLGPAWEIDEKWDLTRAVRAKRITGPFPSWPHFSLFSRLSSKFRLKLLRVPGYHLSKVHTFDPAKLPITGAEFNSVLRLRASLRDLPPRPPISSSRLFLFWLLEDLLKQGESKLEDGNRTRTVFPNSASFLLAVSVPPNRFISFPPCHQWLWPIPRSG